ncbi:MAG: rhamnulokinase [Promethearchaeota archaeon]|jgi:rhamnulokinase
MSKFIAFDIGASSGRVMLGILDANNLKLDEIYRFPNRGIKIDNALCWDISQIFSELLTGLKIYVNKYGKDLNGIGIDTWGVDYVLLDKNDELTGFCYHYRDLRTKGIENEMFKQVPREEFYSETGIQFMEINSAVQLYSMVHANSSQLSIADTFLMVPDYLNFLLCGKKANEYSIATTSQLFNPKKNDWAYSLMERLEFNPNWFKKVIPSGTLLGNLKDDIVERVGLNTPTNIIAPACHDTGSAVAAVPVDMDKYSRGEWAYLSSGTWSLLGVELNEPNINKNALDYNFTNEGGLDNSIRFLKNVTGMWLLQECKRIWANEGINLSWEEIVSKALGAKPFQYFIDPNDPVFLNPDNMVKTIQKYCQDHNQNIPITVSEISRAVFESLAFKYKQVMEKLEELVGVKVKILHVIGGGASNRLLNQFTANSLNIPIKAGPIEATAIGNILIQAYALGQLKNARELRKIVSNSFKIVTYFPENGTAWEVNYEKYIKIMR